MQFDSSFQIWITPNQQLLFPSGGKIKIQIESNLPFLVSDEVTVTTDQNQQIASEKELIRTTASVCFKDTITGPRYVIITVKNVQQEASASCVYYVYKHKNAEQTVQYLQNVIMYQRESITWPGLLFYLKNMWHHRCYKDARKGKTAAEPLLCAFDWAGIADTMISSKTRLATSLEMITKDEVKAILKWINTLADKIQIFPEEFWSFGLLMTCSSSQAKAYLSQHINHALLRFSSEGTFQLCMITGTTMSQGCIEDLDFFLSFLSQDMFKNHQLLALNKECRRAPHNSPIGFWTVELNWVLDKLKAVQKSSNYTLFPALNTFWNFNIMSYMPSFLSGYDSPSPPSTDTSSHVKKRRMSDSSNNNDFVVTTNSKISDVVEHAQLKLDLPPELCADIISKFHKEGFIKMLPLQHLSASDWEKLALPLAMEVYIKQLVQHLLSATVHQPQQSPQPFPPGTPTEVFISQPVANPIMEMIYDPMIPPSDSITILSEIFSASNESQFE